MYRPATALTAGTGDYFLPKPVLTHGILQMIRSTVKFPASTVKFPASTALCRASTTLCRASTALCRASTTLCRASTGHFYPSILLPCQCIILILRRLWVTPYGFPVRAGVPPDRLPRFSRRRVSGGVPDITVNMGVSLW